ncbi:MAG: hypothetical protein AB7I18_04055 [Candidatus Berkiella sp.]
MKKGAVATLPEKAEKRQLNSEDQAVLSFFTALTEQLAKEKGELTQAAFLNAALLAAPSAVRDEICDVMKKAPTSANTPKRKESTDLTVPTAALVSTSALYLVKKKALPLLIKGVPAACSFIPGAAVVPFVMEVAEFATEFGGELVKGYVSKHETDQNKKIFEAADSQFSQLSTLLKAKSPSDDAPILPTMTPLTFSVSAPSAPLLMLTAPESEEQEKSVKALTTLAKH